VPYSRLYYHCVWSTKGREPFIDDIVAPVIAQSVHDSYEEKGLRLHGVGLMPDHVHLAITIPPRFAIADVIGRVKGAATFRVNSASYASGRPKFAWQAEYGVLSFAEKHLPDVHAYVTDQPARHAANRLWPHFERWDDPDPPT